MAEAGSTKSTRRLCSFESLASAPPRPNFPVEDKSHNLRVALESLQQHIFGRKKEKSTYTRSPELVGFGRTAAP